MSNSTQQNISNYPQFLQHSHVDDDCVWCMMSEQYRRNILYTLSDKPLTPTQIQRKLKTEGFEITLQNLSSHLRKLRDCGLIELKRDLKDARRKFYSINTKQLLLVYEFIGTIIHDDRDFLNLLGDRLISFKERVQNEQTKKRTNKKTNKQKNNDS